MPLISASESEVRHYVYFTLSLFSPFSTSILKKFYHIFFFSIFVTHKKYYRSPYLIPHFLFLLFLVHKSQMSPQEFRPVTLTLLNEGTFGPQMIFCSPVSSILFLHTKVCFWIFRFTLFRYLFL
jgi:hypothetical protein